MQIPETISNSDLRELTHQVTVNHEHLKGIEMDRYDIEEATN